LEPVLFVSSGDAVEYELREVSDGQITQDSGPNALEYLDSDRLYPLAGPTYVQDAQQGDVLEIDILDTKAGDWGWSAIMPDFGLLQDEFDKPRLKIWDLSLNDQAFFREDIRVPIEPFCGTMGVAPADEADLEVMPPGRHGGNMDLKHLIKGSTLFLPVWVEGGLFSLGDGHAAQGDGEVCGTAIEAPVHVKLRFKLRKNCRLNEPSAFVPSVSRTPSGEGYYVTLGRSPDLFDAAKSAVRQVVDHVSEEYGMQRWEAYMLSSVATDLKIAEIVDRPYWIVSAFLPLSIFLKKNPLGKF